MLRKIRLYWWWRLLLSRLGFLDDLNPRISYWPNGTRGKMIQGVEEGW